MTYVDANVFVYATLSTEQGEYARNIINLIEQNKGRFLTSCLTYDEVVWSVRKLFDKDKAQEAGSLFLALLQLKLKEVNRETLVEAHNLAKQFSLKPRDAIHLATLILADEKEIISEDADFDKIKGIQRITMKEFLTNKK